MEDLEYARLSFKSESETNYVSNFFDYVSAYVNSPLQSAMLERSILQAYLRVSYGGPPEIVDQDGEMSLMVYPSGVVRLMLPWKSGNMKIETASGQKAVCTTSNEEVMAYLDVVQKRIEKLEKK